MGTQDDLDYDDAYDGTDDGRLECAACQRTCDDYEGRGCGYCTEFICSDCWLPGDDVTGDQCPICGRYELLGP